MAEKFKAGADAIIMDPRDHVVTALKDLQTGQTISYLLKEQEIEIRMVDSVAFGHKIAIKYVAKGEHIRKYGDVIGAATEDIAPGQHVHVHNIEGIRGRGDQVKG